MTGSDKIAVNALTATMLAGACSERAASSNMPRSEQRMSGTRDVADHATKIRIVTKDRTLTATLDDGAASRSFAKLLPLRITLKDYNRTEKIADLPKRLSAEGAPVGIEPSAGDIAYFAPWGNLALFYRDFGYSKGLIRLGRIDGDPSVLISEDSIPVTIERIDD